MRPLRRNGTIAVPDTESEAPMSDIRESRVPDVDVLAGDVSGGREDYNRTRAPHECARGVVFRVGKRNAGARDWPAE